MIRVIFYQNKEDVITRFSFSGHAGYANSGEDIVCSAASMLFINTINAIEKLTEVGKQYQLKEDTRKNCYDFKFLIKPCKEANLLVNTLMLGMEEIAKEYGKEFIKVTLKEV